MINYRYQAMTKEQWIALSPRISLLIPTGGTGMDLLGLQVNIAASKYISEKFIVHFNLGTTFYPNARVQLWDSNEIQTKLQWFNAGGSVIWLVKPDFNILFEYGENFTSLLDYNGGIKHNNETFLNPGIRYAVNFGELQIVPGLGFPVVVREGNTQGGVFFYLSFEHPF